MRVRVLRGAVALLLTGQIALFAQVPAEARSEDATGRAVDWFGQNKAPDGALPGYGNGYTVGGTADGIIALVAAGEKPRRFGRRSGETPVEYLEAHAGDDVSQDDPRDGAHLAGKVALAAALSGEDPHSFGGVNLVDFIRSHYDPSTGGYRGPFASNPLHPFGQGLAILGLIASEEPVPAKALDYLLGSQQPDGGWEFGPGFGSDAATTSMAVQALLAAGQVAGPDPRIEAAALASTDFFRAEQNDDGGFSNQKQYAGNFCSGKRPSEVDATGFSVQAIRAAGRDPEGAEWAKAAGPKPGDFLKSVQNADGSFSFQEGPDCKGNGGSTYAAVLGLEQASFVCLLKLGTCPTRAQTAGVPQATGADLPAAAPGLAVAPPRPGGASPPPGAKSASRAQDNASRPARRTAAMPARATPGCNGADCPGGGQAAGSPPTAASLKAGRAGRGEKPGAPDAAGRLSEKGNGSGWMTYVAVGLIVLLSGSIGRQLLRGRSV